MLSIYIPSCNLSEANLAGKNLGDACDELVIKDGSGYPSFSKLVNDCIDSAAHENVIICSDRCRPNPSDVRSLMELLDLGSG